MSVDIAKCLLPGRQNCPRVRVTESEPARHLSHRLRIFTSCTQHDSLCSPLWAAAWLLWKDPETAIPPSNPKCLLCPHKSVFSGMRGQSSAVPSPSSHRSPAMSGRVGEDVRKASGRHREAPGFLLLPPPYRLRICHQSTWQMFPYAALPAAALLCRQCACQVPSEPRSKDASPHTLVVMQSNALLSLSQGSSLFIQANSAPLYRFLLKITKRGSMTLAFSSCSRSLPNSLLNPTLGWLLLPVFLGVSGMRGELRVRGLVPAQATSDEGLGSKLQPTVPQSPAYVTEMPPGNKQRRQKGEVPQNQDLGDKPAPHAPCGIISNSQDMDTT